MTIRSSEDLSIGRTLSSRACPRQAELASGRGVPGQASACHFTAGTAATLEECKRRFKAIWVGIRDGLSEVDIEAARRIESAAVPPRDMAPKILGTTF
jgi:hypothetical protein